MQVLFELFSLSVFVAAAALFTMRVLRADPPLAPYALVAGSSAAGGLLLARGIELLGFSLTVAAAFLLLQVAFRPARDIGAARPVRSSLRGAPR